MKRKLPDDENSDRSAKRPKVLRELQHDVCVELPSDMWRLILEMLTKDCYWAEDTDTELAHLHLAFLTRVSKRLHLECQKFKQAKSLVLKKIPDIHSFLAHFAKVGSVSGLAYAHERGVEIHPFCHEYAASHGHLDCLKYLHSIGIPMRKSAEAYALYGSLECLKYIYERQGGQWHSSTEMCINATKSGNLYTLKYVHENGGTWDVQVCSKAARLGRLDMLQYAHEHGCPWDDDVCSIAASKGHVDMLKYAHENGCPCNEGSIRAAAHNGHIEAMKYLHDICGTWPIDTCLWAASGDHLECLIYTHEHGAEWNSRWVAEIAVAEDSKKVIEYLRGLGCSIPPKTDEHNLGP